MINVCLPGILLTVLRANRAQFTELLIDRSKHTLPPSNLFTKFAVFRVGARRLESDVYGRTQFTELLIVSISLSTIIIIIISVINLRIYRFALHRG